MAASRINDMRKAHTLPLKSPIGWLKTRFNAFAIARPTVCRLSVWNVRGPYSGDWNFWQCSTPLGTLAISDRPFDKNFTEIVPGKPLIQNRW